MSRDYWLFIWVCRLHSKNIFISVREDIEGLQVKSRNETDSDSSDRDKDSDESGDNDDY